MVVGADFSLLCESFFSCVCHLTSCAFSLLSSEREPSQVFRLLETVYRAFDVEGSKAGVFKVETVGDSYVAVTGLPDPREDHAVLIAKYAIKCLLKFNVLAKRLEPHLGPGTASLGMRFGLHSGPVTAGVLRGEKSRFQLFGDTINVVSLHNEAALFHPCVKK
jgi:class 3 adenylate cyclase